MKFQIGDTVKTGRRTRGIICGIQLDLYNPTITWVYIRRIIGGKYKRFDNGFYVIDMDLLERIN